MKVKLKKTPIEPIKNKNIKDDDDFSSFSAL